MKTLFVSGSDTDVGKTWVVGALAALLASRGSSVQVVKPVETGVTDPANSDVQGVLNNCSNALVSGYTLFSYEKPIAPVAAAEAAIGLAILVVFFRNRGTIAVEDINTMRG